MDVLTELEQRFPDVEFVRQQTADGILTAWLAGGALVPALRHLQKGVAGPFRTLYDLFGIDERVRAGRGAAAAEAAGRGAAGPPAGPAAGAAAGTAAQAPVSVRADAPPLSDYTVVYHLLSYDRNADVRLKVPVAAAAPTVPTITGLWPSADWYERELWDMFGVTAAGHPDLRRLLMPPWWEGHPLRKDHPSRATEMGTFSLPPDDDLRLQDALEIDPSSAEWRGALGGKRGSSRRGDASWSAPARGRSGPGFAAAPGPGPASPGGPAPIYLNVGPQHPGTHGPIRIELQLKDELIVDVVPDIGFHHRGAEKIGERQTWHTYIPYTDRVDYLAGVLNNLPYVLSVEKLAGIEVPPRAEVIRVMMCELFRISSHLVYLGTLAQDLGAITPVFYCFGDRERLMDVIETITGGRMHPSWFRIGGVAQDLPAGWEAMVRGFLTYLPPRLKEYETLIIKSRIVKARTVGVGEIHAETAITWGITGPNLRACGFDWDLRKKRPYSGYDRFDFDIPTADRGDSYNRLRMRVEEIKQSLRIIQQCVDGMPPGPHKAATALATPPDPERMLHHIETLIDHFLGVSWGPVVPPGEAIVPIESAKGNYGYYLLSDGGISPYRLRIRTPSFPHLQALPLLVRGQEIPDLIAVLGTIDFVMGDVDR